MLSQKLEFYDGNRELDMSEDMSEQTDRQEHTPRGAVGENSPGKQPPPSAFLRLMELSGVGVS